MKTLKKISSKIKDIVKERKAKVSSRLKKKLAAPKNTAKKEAHTGLGVEEVAVGSSKFSYPQPSQVKMRYMPQELPGSYGYDRIVLQVRDPWWLHSYWEVSEHNFSRLRDQLGDAYYSAKRILRVYDVSLVIFNGNNAHRFFDLEINPDATSWYIDIGEPGKSWCVDFGLRLADGRFITILRSNTVSTPLAGPSWITDEEWMIPEDMFARLYGMGFGFGRSSPVGKGWQEKIRKEFFSSPGVGSLSSPVKVLPKERKFWLVVNTELIVYGATEPDAKVTVQGKPISLRPDGTFSLRFALPDGKQVIPVNAVSSDNLEERTITPIVNKETK